jgi:hypothetical protein
MAKKRTHKITEEQIIKMHRKVSREENLGDGWVATNKVHPSKKTYNRKKKFK